MAIGMGQSRERVRAEMIEVRRDLGSYNYFKSGTSTDTGVEDDTTCGKATRGKLKKKKNWLELYGY